MHLRFFFEISAFTDFMIVSNQKMHSTYQNSGGKRVKADNLVFYEGKKQEKGDQLILLVYL